MIFSHRYLDSNCINFKSCKILAVYWSIWTSLLCLYNTDIKVQPFFNPLRTKTTLYLFLRENKSLLYHQIGNRNFFIFITIQWNLMFCVDKIKYEHLAIISNLKSCQFAHRIVIFNLWIYVANLRIHRIFRLNNSYEFNCDKWGLIFSSNFFSFFWYIIQNF